MAGEVQPGEVVVIRYEGPKGGPGMMEMLSPTSAIIGMGLGEKVALDHRWAFLGRDPRSLHRSRVSWKQPRAVRSQSCARETSSRLTWTPVLSTSACRTNEIQTRLAALPPFISQVESKWLRRYAHFVTSADQGAVLEEL